MRVRLALLFIVLAVTCLPALAASTDRASQAQQQAALHALAGQDMPEAASIKGVALAPWTHGPTGAGPLWVVAALILPPGDDAAVQLWTGVLRQDGDGFQLLADDRSERPDTSPMPWSLDVRLDLIPYRISAQETAFGVRFSNSYDSTAHSDYQEQLSLYRYAGQALTPIFTALTDTSTYDKDGVQSCTQDKAGAGKEPSEAQQDACDRENTVEAHYVLAFGNQTHQDHYDLLVRAKPGSTASAKARAGLRFTWNGKTYAPRTFDGGQ